MTSKERITGETFVRLASEKAGRPYAVQALPKFGVRMIGLFVPVLREIVEMMYQYEEDYVFDSTKMERAFNERPTSYQEGIAQIIT